MPGPSRPVDIATYHKVKHIGADSCLHDAHGCCLSSVTVLHLVIHNTCAMSDSNWAQLGKFVTQAAVTQPRVPRDNCTNKVQCKETVNMFGT